MHELAQELAPRIRMNAVAINSAIPMCELHGACGRGSYEYENWIKPMVVGTQALTLQDNAKINFWKQVGRGLQFHDDLAVYDRCGRLYQHLCTGGMMGTCSKLSSQALAWARVGDPNLMYAEGVSTLRRIALLAAEASASRCPCSGGPGSGTTTAAPRPASLRAGVQGQLRRQPWRIPGLLLPAGGVCLLSAVCLCARRARQGAPPADDQPVGTAYGKACRPEE
mmetsp:Transcript_80398/g.239511  ORF Transcript_80398/g.239511 Transcript_80398/m.239511 type:complete len:224 (+) Transcript_80398:271-942(+)